MKYLHSMIRVSNLEKTLHFFCDLLGFKELRRNDYASGRFTLVFLATPQDIETYGVEHCPTVELTHNWDEAGYSEGRNFGHLAYRVENIYTTCQTLQDAGVAINRPPRDGRMAFVRTPDNISIELLQEGEPLEPSEPWLSQANSGKW